MTSNPTRFDFSDIVWEADHLDVPTTAIIMQENEQVIVSPNGDYLKAFDPITSHTLWDSFSTVNTRGMAS